VMEKYHGDLRRSRATERHRFTAAAVAAAAVGGAEILPDRTLTRPDHLGLIRALSVMDSAPTGMFVLDTALLASLSRYPHQVTVW